jgi:signal transduction histidine kinase
MRARVLEGMRHLSFYGMFRAFVRYSENAVILGGMLVRQQQAADERDLGAHAAAGRNVSPSAPAGGTAETAGKRREPRDSQSRDAGDAGDLMAEIVALSHLLVAPLPLDAALDRALAIGARLLPDTHGLRLLAPRGDGLVTLAEQGARPAGATLDEPATTLGFGADVDEQVLSRHLPASVHGAQCVPLIGPDGVLIGVLIAATAARAATGDTGEHALDAALAALSARWRLVLDHLAALLDRAQLAERAAHEARARDEYISLAAHELRSPLTSIKGYAQLLARQARKTPLPDSMRRSVEAIEQQSMRMAEMIGELLDASRIRRGALELLPAPAELQASAARVVERRRPLFPQHEFVVAAPAEPLAGAWDAARVEQVLRDLLDNAARHSPNGGAITLAMRREDRMALVSVRDTGIGVAADDRERIFEYLYRAAESQRRNLSGLGLGLFVSRHLVERMGGRLWLEASSTTPPAGSEFRFTLPLA